MKTANFDQRIKRNTVRNQSSCLPPHLPASRLCIPFHTCLLMALRTPPCLPGEAFLHILHLCSQKFRYHFPWARYSPHPFPSCILALRRLLPHPDPHAFLHHGVESFSFVVSASLTWQLSTSCRASDVVHEGASCLVLLCKVHVVSPPISSGGGVGRVLHRP